MQTDTVNGREFSVLRRFTTKGCPSGFEVTEGTFSMRFYSYHDAMRVLDLLEFGACFGMETFDSGQHPYRITSIGTRMPSPKGLITIVGGAA